jgi:hypothetical protein
VPRYNRVVRLLGLLALTLLAACQSGSLQGQGLGPVLDPIPAYPVPSCAIDPSPVATSLLVGFSGDDVTAVKPGFHLRYQYIGGAVSPSAACIAPGRAKAQGCGTDWWGTWQSDQDPPGAFVRGFVADAETAHLLPMLTYYVILPASGVAEGAPEVTQAARDPAFLRRYLNDFRFLLIQLGCARALVHLEPDFWGYAQQEAVRTGGTASTLPAAVREANPADCGAEADTIAGLGRCMVAMVRKWAPNAKVGLHASAWGTRFDCILNTNVSLDVSEKGAETAAFLDPAGAASSDFVVADIADRDAGWRGSQGQNTWINATSTLPSYAQAFAWSRALATGIGKPLLWWQVPVGNMSLPNTTDEWRDNKVAYFFDHPDLVVAGGAIGMAFGAGASGQTTPETDGGYLWQRAASLAGAGGQPLPGP